MPNTQEVQIVWKLKRYLASQGVTPYALAQAMAGTEKTNQKILYGLEDEESVRTTGRTLERILSGIRRLGLEATVSDIVGEKDA